MLGCVLEVLCVNMHILIRVHGYYYNMIREDVGDSQGSLDWRLNSKASTDNKLPILLRESIS